MKKGVYCLLAMTVVASLFFVPSTAAPQKEEILKFGAINPYTGPAGWIGETFTRGIDMAVAEINAKGGIGGVKLQAIKEDSKALPKEGATAMVKLATLDKVPFVQTTFSSVTLAAQPVAVENKVLQIDIGSSASEMLDKPFLYTISVPNVYMSSCLAVWMAEKGYRKGGTLVLSDAHGRDVADKFVKKWKALGGTMVVQEEYARGDVDFSAQLAKIKAAKPDVVIGSGVGKDFTLLMIQWKEHGIEAIHANGKSDPLASDAAGAAAIGVMAIDFMLDVEAVTARDFVKAYHSKYGKNPYWIEANGYEGVMILAELIKRAKAKGKDYRKGEVLRDMLEANREFSSLYAKTTKFFDDHSAPKPLSIIKVVGTKPYKHETLKVFSLDEMVRLKLK